MPPEPKPRITLSDLDNAPGVIDDGTFGSGHEVEFTRRFRDLASENEQLKQNLDKERREKTADQILNGLIEPISKNVFIFMCVYCGFVGVTILMNSFGCFKVSIDREVIKILVGSTAATVLGLVGMVLTGVFLGARRRIK